MKRYCKNIDITSRELISEATWSCISNKITRSDTIHMFMEYTGLPYQFLMDMAQESRYMPDSIVETVIDTIHLRLIEMVYVE